jgi:hypothetical protein
MTTNNKHGEDKELRHSGRDCRNPDARMASVSFRLIKIVELSF